MNNDTDYSQHTPLTRRMLQDSDNIVKSKIQAAITAANNEQIMAEKMDDGEIDVNDYIATNDFATAAYEDAVDYFSKVLRNRGTNLDAEIINIEHS